MPTNSKSPLAPALSGWEAAELSNLQEGAQLTFRERLLWLQDMLEFTERFAGTASGRKLDRDGNIVQVIRSAKLPTLMSPVVPSSVVL